jgi:hypothetical protein
MKAVRTRLADTGAKFEIANGKFQQNLSAEKALARVVRHDQKGLNRE